MDLDRSSRWKLVVVRGTTRPQDELLLGSQAQIGRAAECELIILDDTASRLHAVLERDGEHYRCRDLGSSNGTWVNGVRTDDTMLRNGDEIAIGEIRLVFSDATAASKITVVNTSAQPTSPGIGQGLAVDRSIPGANYDPTEGEDRVLLKRLKALYRVSTALAKPLRADDLLLEVLCSLSEVVPYQRGAVSVLVGERLEPRAFFHPGNPKESDQTPFEVSSTLLERVIKSREGVLVHDMLCEEDLRSKRSVLDAKTLSAAAVPLLVDDSCVGVLYVDSLRTETFTDEDLELLMGVGAPTALSLRKAQSFARADLEAQRLRREIRQGHEMVGGSPELVAVLEQIQKIAPSDMTVLITGETGTGKELVARALHDGSTRRDGPFVAVNCAALSPALLESELFGHRSGAFTGADRDAPGQFRLADGGTLFLDEVGELPVQLQTKLLRALEERRVRPVGEDHTIPVDLRVVAATNRDLKTAIQDGTFRNDLYYRLGAVRLRVPPLRDRTGDLRVLAQSFLDEVRKRLPQAPGSVEPEVFPVLEAYDWPGNVRELKNVIERAAVLADSPEIRLIDLPADVRFASQGRPDPGVGPCGPATPSTLKEAERRAIAAALATTKGKKGEAARILGISWPTLTKKLREYGLSDGSSAKKN